MGVRLGAVTSIDGPMTLLQFLRLKRGLSQKQLAELAGVSPTTVNIIETRRLTRPFGPGLARLASALGYVGDPQELLEVVQAELVIKGSPTVCPECGSKHWRFICYDCATVLEYRPVSA